MLYKQEFVLKIKNWNLSFSNYLFSIIYTITKMYLTYILIIYANTNHEIVCL